MLRQNMKFALLHSVPFGKMIVLDLFADVKPIWEISSQFYGTPYIWCFLHNFGGNIEMYGLLDSVSSGPIDARLSQNSTMSSIIRWVVSEEKSATWKCGNGTNKKDDFNGSAALWLHMIMMLAVEDEMSDGKQNNGRCVGVGLCMEGIEQNPVVYELMSEMAFRSQKVQVELVLGANWYIKTAAYIKLRY
ncbi:hypothetical protein ACLOJK_025329 [Asimina triloba]